MSVSSVLLCPCAGSVLLSGSADGLLTVSSVSSGLVVRVIQDHRGAPITDLRVARKPVQVCVCVIVHMYGVEVTF